MKPLCSRFGVGIQDEYGGVELGVVWIRAERTERKGRPRGRAHLGCGKTRGAGPALVVMRSSKDNVLSTQVGGYLFIGHMRATISL